MLMGNSHTGNNFRIPLTETTHDPDCDRNCVGRTTVRRLQRLMAQAARRATKYFTGYLQKPQPLGRQALQQAAQRLRYLEDPTSPVGQEQQRYAKVVRRVFGDLEFRCSVRPLTEETMLAHYWDGHEPTSAECIRSFPVTAFVGLDWLNLLDHAFDAQVRIGLQTKGYRKVSQLYGWRGVDPQVYYLSPWEFVALWEAKQLRPPKQDNPLAIWLPASENLKDTEQAEFGVHYSWVDPLPPAWVDDIVQLPKSSATAAAANCYFQRRTAPVIPFPTSCPLPRHDMTFAARCRFFNVYLRPWTPPRCLLTRAAYCQPGLGHQRTGRTGKHVHQASLACKNFLRGAQPRPCLERLRDQSRRLLARG